MHVTSSDNCWSFVTQNGAVVRKLVPELKCSQEEADTGMLFHANHAAHNGFASVCLCSPDTDVAVIGISLASQVPAQLIFRTGTQQRRCYIDLSAIAEKQGEAAVSLIGLHCFTGCDFCSAFSGKGKKKALLLLKDHCHCQAMAKLGQTFDAISPQMMSHLEAFVCSLYGKANLTDVNEACYKLFCAKGCSTSLLPPCRDALQLHAKCANYQAAVWR